MSKPTGMTVLQGGRRKAFRPLPAERTGVSLLALRVRRRRYRDGIPKQRGG